MPPFTRVESQEPEQQGDQSITMGYDDTSFVNDALQFLTKETNNGEDDLTVMTVLTTDSSSIADAATTTDNVSVLRSIAATEVSGATTSKVASFFTKLLDFNLCCTHNEHAVEISLRQSNDDNSLIAATADGSMNTNKTSKAATFYEKMMNISLCCTHDEQAVEISLLPNDDNSVISLPNHYDYDYHGGHSNNNNNIKLLEERPTNTTKQQPQRGNNENDTEDRHTTRQLVKDIRMDILMLQAKAMEEEAEAEAAADRRNKYMAESQYGLLSSRSSRRSSRLQSRLRQQQVVSHNHRKSNQKRASSSSRETSRYSCGGNSTCYADV